MKTFKLKSLFLVLAMITSVSAFATVEPEETGLNNLEKWNLYSFKDKSRLFNKAYAASNKNGDYYWGVIQVAATGNVANTLSVMHQTLGKGPAAEKVKTEIRAELRKRGNYFPEPPTRQIRQFTQGSNEQFQVPGCMRDDGYVVDESRKQSVVGRTVSAVKKVFSGKAK